MDPIFEIFVGLAGIAGVFVGFGALVVLSDHDGAKTSEIHMVRNVTAIGLLTLVGALVPVMLVLFNLSDHLLWSLSGAVFLTLIWFGLLHPTNRPVLITMMKLNTKASLFFWLVLEPIIQLPLLFCILDTFPDYSPAFYMTSVIVNLIQCAQSLLQVVYDRVERTN